MKSKVLWLVLVAFSLVIFSCGEKQTEKDFLDLAYQYMEQQNWEKAEENFIKISDDYPNGMHTSKAIFMVGYINANHLDNYDKAREFYTTFLEKFPDHELANDAQYELNNLGKSADELPFMIEDSDGSASTEGAN